MLMSATNASRMTLGESEMQRRVATLLGEPHETSSTERGVVHCYNVVFFLFLFLHNLFACKSQTLCVLSIAAHANLYIV